MTMPIGSTQEPEEVMVQEQSVPVRVVSSGRGSSSAEHGYWRTFTLTPTTAPVRIASRSLRRKRLIIKVNGSLPAGNLATPAQPVVPASTTAIQNNNPFPVLVNLSGFTLTAVTVNGVQVGTTNSPPAYLVPSGGTIAVTYTVQGTWTWTNANVGQNQSPTDGVFVANRDVANNTPGPASIPFTLGTFQNGGYLQMGDNIRWEVQQELWVIPNSANSATVYLTVSDEMYASDPMNSGQAKKDGDDD